MSHHCLTVVSFIYIYIFFIFIYLCIGMYKKQKTVSALHFCTKKVTVLFFVHSIAWTGEQMDGEERFGQSQR